VSTNSIENRRQRERGLGAVAPQSGVALYLKMSETHILIRLLRMYLPQNWEFGSALSKLRIFLGGWGEFYIVLYLLVIAESVASNTTTGYRTCPKHV
jgi:hypothetical protein